MKEIQDVLINSLNYWTNAVKKNKKEKPKKVAGKAKEN